MHLVYYGKVELTDEQVDIIFRDCISTRVEELRRIYKSDWDKLRVNERITIISLYFNNKNLAGGHTNFYNYITNYIKTGDLVYLKQAVNEVEKNRIQKDLLEYKIEETLKENYLPLINLRLIPDQMNHQILQKLL